ncbi:MAG: thiamine pyrophosphate-dependent enzyme, partial [Sphingobium sp.]
IADQIEAATKKRDAFLPGPVERTPYFCSGCPHNSSTRVPEGSRAMAGIGCHWMSQAMDRNTATYTHMGGEGANWIGQAPFVPTKHIFQNMGDGTFFHSGLLAIRAALAARMTMTYKILFNDAVAMTGGQTHDGTLTAQRITQMVRGEGVQRIAVVADDPDKYPDHKDFAEGVTIHHRDDLDAVQRELREVPGVSVLVYDQVCAASKRRRKKGMAAPKAETRVLINELVCEGCGDCSVKSNCLSVTPVDTEFGRKRRIDQTSCNTDLSCVKGFCPSFVTVTGGKLRKGGGGGRKRHHLRFFPATGTAATLPRRAAQYPRDRCRRDRRGHDRRDPGNGGACLGQRMLHPRHDGHGPEGRPRDHASADRGDAR